MSIKVDKPFLFVLIPISRFVGLQIDNCIPPGEEGKSEVKVEEEGF
jgi:hypothetical protein